MVTAAKNQFLTEVSAGTPMGELLRRYWWPIAGASELRIKRVLPIRLLAEDLVLFDQGKQGVGLMQRHCPHRGADLAFGLVDEAGLRCFYHGWKFDLHGRCIEQPYEDIAVPQLRSKQKVAPLSYPARIHGGVVWAYLGPSPEPEIPDWEFFNWENGFREIIVSRLPCNWFQCQENSIDPVHFEWAHENWEQYLRPNGEGRAPPRHIRIAFDEFDYGFVYRRIRDGQDESNPLWSVGRVCLWPNALFTGQHVEWRVPVDRENTLSIAYAYTRLPKRGQDLVQKEVPTWYGPIHDSGGRLIDTHVLNQDFIAWLGQGRIADRTREHLAHSDAGIAAIRRQYEKDAAALVAGKDPKAVIRDPSVRNIRLPIADPDFYLWDKTAERLPERFRDVPRSYGDILQAGQPDAVALEFREMLERSLRD